MLLAASKSAALMLSLFALALWSLPEVFTVKTKRGDLAHSTVPRLAAGSISQGP